MVRKTQCCTGVHWIATTTNLKIPIWILVLTLKLRFLKETASMFWPNTVYLYLIANVIQMVPVLDIAQLRIPPLVTKTTSLYRILLTKQSLMVLLDLRIPLLRRMTIKQPGTIRLKIGRAHV